MTTTAAMGSPGTPLGSGIPRDWPLFVAGEWVSGDRRRLDVIDPATEEIVATTPVATASDLDRAAASVGRSWQAWASVDVWTRSRMLRDVAGILERRRDDISTLIVREQGKTLAEARAEAVYAAETFDWYADEARRVYGRVIAGHDTRTRLAVLRQPVGPVVAMTPWNFPIVTPARKMAPALAAGCTVILKPSEETPGPAHHLVDACLEAGIPPEAMGLVTGEPAAISKRLIGAPEIRKISFTGSVPVGRQLMRQCADGIKGLTLELGGHAPVLVLRDADLDLAVEQCVSAKYRNGGQVCIAPSRFFVEEPLFEAFTERFIARVGELRLGPGLDAATDVGPLISERRRAAVEALVDDAVAGGASVRCGGRRPADLERGYFYEPTVLTGVRADAAIMRDEPFGPVAPIVGVADAAEALRVANDTPFGLAGYVFTDDMTSADVVSEALEVGLVGINTCFVSTVEAPFGGIKQSGLGTENGPEGIEAYTVVKYTQRRHRGA